MFFVFVLVLVWALYIQLVGSRSAVGVLRGESEGERGRARSERRVQGWAGEGPEPRGRVGKDSSATFLLTLLPLSPWSRRVFGSRREGAPEFRAPAHAASGVTVLFRVRVPLRTRPARSDAAREGSGFKTPHRQGGDSRIPRRWRAELRLTFHPSLQMLAMLLDARVLPDSIWLPPGVFGPRIWAGSAGAPSLASSQKD